MRARNNFGRFVPEWTTQEVAILKQGYPSEPKEVLMAKLPDKSWRAIHLKAHRLHIRRLLSSQLQPERTKTRFNLNVTLPELGYIAGLIDGEGTLTLELGHNGRCIYPLLQVTNTNKNIAEWLLYHVGGHVSVTDAKNPKNKPSFKWRLKAIGHIETLLKRVLPFLIIKKPQAKVLLRFVRRRLTCTRGEYSVDDWKDLKEIRALNKTGKFGSSSFQGVEPGAEKLVKAIKGSKDGKLVLGDMEYSLVKSDTFIQRKPLKKKE